MMMMMMISESSSFSAWYNSKYKSNIPCNRTRTRQQRFWIMDTLACTLSHMTAVDMHREHPVGNGAENQNTLTIAKLRWINLRRISG